MICSIESLTKRVEKTVKTILVDLKKMFWIEIGATLIIVKSKKMFLGLQNGTRNRQKRLEPTKNGQK